MKINYTTFLKHAHKVTKTAPNSRPILQGVHHTENEIMATDAHRLYYAANVNAPKNTTLDKKGNELEGTYPNVKNLLPQSSPEKTFMINDLDAFTQLLKAFQFASKLDEQKHACLILKNNHIQLDSNSLVMEYPIAAHSTLAEPIYLQIDYVLEAAEFIKDMGAQSITFNLWSAARPITITTPSTDDLLALILPVRKP